MRLFINLLLLLLVASASPAVLAENSRQNKNFVIMLPVNVNTADANKLDLVMDGIGPKKAQAIIQYRDLNGPFKSIDELSRVKGIGAGTLERNRGRISVN